MTEAAQKSQALNRSIQVQQELVQRALATAQQTIQDKIAEYNAELQATWKEIAKAHGIDINQILWDFDPDSGEIYVKAIQFGPTGT